MMSEIYNVNCIFTKSLSCADFAPVKNIIRFCRASAFDRTCSAAHTVYDLASLQAASFVCLSVRPSVRHVPVFYGNGLTYCHNFFTVGSPIILVLRVSNIFAKFRWGHPVRGAKYRWCIKNFAIFDQ